MFSGFNLSAIDLSEELRGYYQKGTAHFERYKNRVEANLNKYICENGSLSGTEIQKDWFPEVNADIFLSHSHKDEETVIALAGWLNEKFGLKEFIDSCIWGYAPDLLKILDDEFCVSERGGRHTIYNYEKRNYSTSHVYMMLSIALSKMIDKAESLFFYNTPSSITTESSIDEGSTNSPWIYHELQTSTLIRHRPLSEYRRRKITKDSRDILEHAQLTINYDVTLEHLVKINADNLNDWLEVYSAKSCQYPLDELYKQKGLLKGDIYGYTT
jgi:hypothetical protein